MGRSVGSFLRRHPDHVGRRTQIRLSRRRQLFRCRSDLEGVIGFARPSDGRRQSSKAMIPVFFLQAENDYDLTPNRVLSEEVRKAGKSVETKTYPAFGSGAQEGHSFCWPGTIIWGPDVLKFIEANLRPG